MQGVILGVGISMLEQMFVDQINEMPHNKESKPRSSKRRKPNPPGKDLDDDDDIYYTPVGGKRAKGGTGYAGDQKEDVRFSSCTSFPPFSYFSEFWSSRGTSYTTGEGRKDWRTAHRNSSIPAIAT